MKLPKRFALWVIIHLKALNYFGKYLLQSDEVVQEHKNNPILNLITILQRHILDSFWVFNFRIHILSFSPQQMP